MYERSSINGCCFEVESVPDAAKIANVIVARSFLFLSTSWQVFYIVVTVLYYDKFYVQ